MGICLCLDGGVKTVLKTWRGGSWRIGDLKSRTFLTARASLKVRGRIGEVLSNGSGVAEMWETPPGEVKAADLGGGGGNDSCQKTVRKEVADGGSHEGAGLEENFQNILPNMHCSHHLSPNSHYFENTPLECEFSTFRATPSP